MNGPPLRRNRRALLGVVAVAMVPLLAAYALFHTGWSAEPWGTTNNGVLLDPPIELAKLGLTGIGADAAVASKYGRA